MYVCMYVCICIVTVPVIELLRRLGTPEEELEAIDIYLSILCPEQYIDPGTAKVYVYIYMYVYMSVCICMFVCM